MFEDLSWTFITVIALLSGFGWGYLFNGRLMRQEYNAGIRSLTAATAQASRMIEDAEANLKASEALLNLASKEHGAEPDEYS